MKLLVIFLFKEEFKKQPLDDLVLDGLGFVMENGKLAITSTANQDSPLMEGKTPILGLDVWEHAYYLKYKMSDQIILQHSGMLLIGMK